ncbi:transcription initiation factor TFIID subunit 4-like [Herpailurus yagouaroundi]|uniref:transcription initiation factor TFIID subunit 4-like n=1 Tax=Herpailurus yagouaroundi TaxID=1608482 RepID=UPI001AD7E2C0|nr:transcription initiation factor TFIID subunit 4-like [Puma yagouaroundi]
MSDASLPRRCPRSPVSAPPRTRGGNSTSSGGGSHLKPPAPGSSCKNETPIRLAPQEDIDDSPPPGRAAQFRAPGARSSLAKPRQSATSCPRSPPPSPGHGQRPAAALRGRSPPASGGRGEETPPQTGRQRKRGRNYCPKPPAGSADPPCSPSRAQPAASESGSGGASRAPSAEGGEPGTRARRGPAGSPRRARAFGPSAIFLGSPEPPLPRFHRPQLAPPPPPPPPPPRFSAMQLQGSLFPRLRSPTLPDSEGRRRAGGGEGWASEPRASAEASGPRPLGRPPGLGVSHLLGKNFAPAAGARETRAGLSRGAVMRSPPAAE